MSAAHDNPNVYDDEAYTRAVNDLADAIYALWVAGASEENMDEEYKNAKENCA